MNITNLPTPLLQELGTYLPPREMASAIVASKEVFQEPFRKSAVQLLRDFSKKLVFRTAFKEAKGSRDIPERKWKRIVARVDHGLNRRKSLLNREEWASLRLPFYVRMGDLSYLQKIRVGEKILEKRSGILLAFFEKLARLVPEAREFWRGLPSVLSKDVIAEEIRKWMQENRQLLNEALRQNLNEEERKRFREDRITTRLGALLWGLEEFPKELFLLELSPEVLYVVYYILATLNHTEPLEELVNNNEDFGGIAPPIESLLTRIAGEGYAALVKGLLNSKLFHALSEPHLVAFLETSLVWAVHRGRTGVVRILLESPVIQDALPLGISLLQMLEDAAENNFVDTFTLLLQKGELEYVPVEILVEYFPQILDQAESERRIGIVQAIRAWSRWPEIEAERERRIRQLAAQALQEGLNLLQSSGDESS